MPRAALPSETYRAEWGDEVAGDARRRPRRPLARALGWFSVGLGISQLVAPRRLGMLIGIEDDPRNRLLVRAVGAREVGTGAAILARPGAGFLFARVVGDAMDLMLLRAALSGRGNRRRRVGAAAGAVAGVAVVDAVATARARRRSPGTIRARTAITVNHSPEDVYRYWRRLENLPTFMDHLQSVRSADGRSHWVAKGPAGTTVEWDAEVVEDRPAELIAWRSVGGVPNRGWVRFARAPGDRGTEVTVDLEFEPRGGAAGAAVARLVGEDPRQQIKDDLRRFKQVIETGEVARSDGAPDGTRTQRQVRQRPAQPLPSPPQHRVKTFGRRRRRGT